MQARQVFFCSRVFWVIGLMLGPLFARAEDITDRRIEHSDLLIIEVLNEKNLSVECRVQKGGTIRYPLLDDVELGGKTPGEVATLLKEQLGADYLVNPEVMVNVKQYRSRTVSVIGKVMKAGPVQLPEEERMDIIQAIAQAGGFQPNAKESKILFTRNGKTVTYNFKDLKKITDENKKVWLEPGDVIEVKESFF